MVTSSKAYRAKLRVGVPYQESKAQKPPPPPRVTLSGGKKRGSTQDCPLEISSGSEDEGARARATFDGPSYSNNVVGAAVPESPAGHAPGAAECTVRALRELHSSRDRIEACERRL